MSAGIHGFGFFRQGGSRHNEVAGANDEGRERRHSARGGGVVHPAIKHRAPAEIPITPSGSGSNLAVMAPPSSSQQNPGTATGTYSDINKYWSN